MDVADTGDDVEVPDETGHVGAQRSRLVAVPFSIWLMRAWERPADSAS